MRKDCREQYPAREFLELAATAGVPLLINSDAHAVDELAAALAMPSLWRGVRATGKRPDLSNGISRSLPCREAGPARRHESNFPRAR